MTIGAFSADSENYLSVISIFDGHQWKSSLYEWMSFPRTTARPARIPLHAELDQPVIPSSRNLTGNLPLPPPTSLTGPSPQSKIIGYTE